MARRARLRSKRSPIASLLALEPGGGVRICASDFPEFEKLLDERLALYQAKTEARIPLDFTTEILPAEVQSARQGRSRRRCSRPREQRAKRIRLSTRKGSSRKRARRIKKIEHVEQIDEMDCGAASLGMICRHFGRKVSLSRIRQLCHTATDGTSLKALCRAATELGLAARALKVSLRNLPICRCRRSFIGKAITGLFFTTSNEKFVRVADPAMGLRKIPRADFEAKWTGYAALFDYTDRVRTGAGEQTGARLDLCRSSPSSKAILLQVLWLAVAVSVPAADVPGLHPDGGRQRHRRTRSRSAEDDSARHASRPLFSCNCARWRRNTCSSFAAVRLDTAILDFLSRKLLSLPMTYFTSRRTGDIQRRLDGARQVRQFAVGQGIGALLALDLPGRLALPDDDIQPAV